MDKRNPWKKHTTRVIYENPWLRLREDTVTRPDGSEGIYGVVDTRVATAACALTPHGEVYLVGQYRYPTDVYSWELVEGGADPGEDPLDAIKRELREEAGLVAHKWTALSGEIHMSNCISSEVGYIYVAEELEEVEPEPDATEVLTVQKVPVAEALAMVDRNEIFDAFSIMGLLKLERYLRARRKGYHTDS